MTEVAFRSDQVANALLEGLDVGKPAVTLAAPDELVAQFDLKHTGGRVIWRESDFSKFAGEGAQ